MSGKACKELVNKKTANDVYLLNVDSFPLHLARLSHRASLLLKDMTQFFSLAQRTELLLNSFVFHSTAILNKSQP